MLKFLFILFCILSTQIEASEEIHEANGIFYKTNRFGDIFPIWQNIPENELTEKLLVFIEAVKEKKAPVIIEIPHETSSLLNAVIKSNFRFHYADQKKSEWIVKNDSPIPCPFTAISGAHILVISDGKVLVIEERTRKGILGLPAGGAEPGEFARETASRELREEVGLIAQPQDLKLIALINRKRANKQGASLYGHCFIAEEATGSLEIDPREIFQAFWVSLTELAEASEIHGLQVSPYINAVARHILNGCHSSYSLQLPDIRQTPVAFDPNDLMNVEFFQQALKHQHPSAKTNSH